MEIKKRQYTHPRSLPVALGGSLCDGPDFHDGDATTSNPGQLDARFVNLVIEDEPDNDNEFKLTMRSSIWDDEEEDENSL